VSEAPVRNALSVDVEDYFQVSAFEGTIDRADWGRWPVRVERNVLEMLDLFDEHRVRGTFFTLGWVAERFPRLVREIAGRGHEVASHGSEHRLVHSMTPEAFRDDLRRAGRAIADATGRAPRGFRAPSFSFTPGTLWAYEVLLDEGYAYSSSVFPVRHDRYGIPSFPREPVRIVDGDGRMLWEFPMTTLRLLGRNVPASGGGWLRVLPPAVLRRAFARENAAGRPAMLYVHPWEIDPDQPRVPAPRAATWRHRVNLARTRDRLAGLLRRFAFDRVDRVLEGRASSGLAPTRTLRSLAESLGAVAAAGERA
jgi:polysaccharide deacetylase family protein (PEP-CTERM system associated)